MTPTVDRFRALARSSPWRWTSLHLVRHGDPEGATVEAWVDRTTHSTRVRGADGRTRRVTEESGGATVFSFYVPSGGAPSRPPAVRHVAPHEVAAPRDADGLVAVRPEDLEDPDGTIVLVDYGDPMVENYQWVAMLDPVELSHHVRLTDLVACDRRGRATWTATAVPEPGYDPRCGCCPLLSSELADRDELGEDFERWHRRGQVYPTSHRVSLDVATGVVVVLAPQGEGHEVQGWSVEVVEVDGPDPFG